MATKVLNKRPSNTSSSTASPTNIAQELVDPGEPNRNDTSKVPSEGTNKTDVGVVLTGEGDLTQPPSDLSVGETRSPKMGQGKTVGKSEDEKSVLTPATIVKLATDAQKTKFLQDQHGNVFAWILTTDKDQHHECLRLRSKTLRARLLDRVIAETNRMPQPSVLQQAIEILELQAYRSPRIELANRHSVHNNRTLIDLGDPGWRMIAVTKKGWKVEQQRKPLFYRPQHQQALCEPIGGGNPWDLFNFVPIDTSEEKLLVLTWTLAALYPVVPKPILALLGEQGSAKSTRSRRLRSLSDPSVIPLLGDIERFNLFLTFQHHAVPCFENVSHLNRREADMFCRAVTGNGVERRKLRTDSDQALYSFRRPIIINGIDIPSTRPDFLDRCLIINCRRIDKFKTLQELDREFEEARPRLLGAILDLLVKTLRLQGATPPADEFRMADFARFGRAVAQALGKTAKDFDDAYRLNICQQNFEVLEDSPMARLLMKFAGAYTKTTPWVGTLEELLERLKALATHTRDTDAKKDLPRSGRWLSSRLGELTTALAMQGVIVTKLKRTNTSRQRQIYKATPASTSEVTDAVRKQMNGGESHE